MALGVILLCLLETPVPDPKWDDEMDDTTLLRSQCGAQEQRIAELEKAAEMKDARIDWTVSDNAVKAVQLADLQSKLDASLVMLRKYANIVGANEGVDFLYPGDWTREEWEIWRSVTKPKDRTEPLPEWSGAVEKRPHIDDSPFDAQCQHGKRLGEMCEPCGDDDDSGRV